MNKTLIFEGAGWEKAESSVISGVGNCRIRTRIRNNDGRVIYLEMGGVLITGKHIPHFAKGFNIVGRVDHCFYADSRWDSNMNYSDSLKMAESRNFEYNKETILKWVNDNLNCSFNNMEVINDNSIRVHDTEEPICDCSNGDYEPYKDNEVNISILDGIKPLQQFPQHRLAQYKINYDFVNAHKNLKKWIESRSEQEQAKFSQYTYFVSLRWDQNGVITSAELSSRQNFCTMGLGFESLEPVITAIKQSVKQLVTV
jgi:glutaredoxin-related protein